MDQPSGVVLLLQSLLFPLELWSDLVLVFLGQNYRSNGCTLRGFYPDLLLEPQTGFFQISDAVLSAFPTALHGDMIQSDTMHQKDMGFKKFR